MKILYDHQIFTLQKFGGVNRYFLELMKMGEEGVEVDRVDPALFRQEGVKPATDLFSRGSRFVKKRLGLQHPPAPKPFPPRAAAQLQQGDFNLLHPTYYDPYFLEWTGKPFVLTVFDMIYELYAEYFLPDPLRVTPNKRLLCDKAEQIIAISEKTKEDLVGLFHIPPEKVHAIPLASGFDRVVPRKPARFDGIENYILFVGSREVYKNFYFPATALADLLMSDPHLQLLCTGLPFTAWEKDFFADLGIARQVCHTYLESDQELAWVYRHAALFIFPSLYEGFGFPLLEAFASSCPVISSTGGSLPEIAGPAARYFDPRNANEIRAAAHTVLYDTPVREELIRKGHERFQHYSWERCRKQTMEVYRQCLNLDSWKGGILGR